MWWSNPVIVLVLQVLICSAVKQRLIGGPEPLTAEDFRSNTFDQLLNEANAECNKRTDDRYWYKIDSVLDGTKQVVSGVKYGLRIRQRPTDCEKEMVLKPSMEHLGSACVFRYSDQATRLCTVDVWHQPWLKNQSKVTLNSLWHVDPLDKLFLRFRGRVSLHGSEWELLKPDVAQAVLRYNLQNATEHVYKLAELDFDSTQTIGDPGQTLTVHLDETECKKVTSSAEHDAALDMACYNETTGNVLVCDIQVNRPEQAPTVTHCEAPRQGLRGMWRLGGGPEGTKAPCDGSTTLSDTELSKRFTLHNIARSNARLLTVDEVHAPKFRKVVQSGVHEDNIRNNNLYLFAFHAVKHARLQTEPKPVYEVRMVLRPTNCTKNQGYLEDPERFEAECQATQPNARYRTCTFKIPLNGVEQKSRHLFEVDECKTDLPFKMLGARAHLPETERQAESFQSMLKRVVEKYNQESNSSYVFELHKVDNVEHQTVQGKLYTMNITMKATRYKEESNEQEMSSVNETFLHCRARVWQQPWIQSESINLTDCWKSVRLLQPIHSSWTPVTLQDLKQANVSFLRPTERVRVPFMNHELVADHVTDAFLVEVKYKKLYTFGIQLRNSENSSEIFVGKVIQPSGEGEFKNQAAFIQDWRSIPPTKGLRKLLGAPKSLNEKDLQSVEFQEKMEQVTEMYNRVQNDLYYYNYAGVKNATKQLVSGTKTVAFVYMERTSCRKGEHDHLLRSKRYSLCGTGPDSHRRAQLCEVHVLEKLNESPAHVQIKECTPAEPSELQSIHPFVPFDLQHTSTYRTVVNLAMLVYNLYQNHSVFYRIHHVENFNRTLKDAAKSEYQFDLVMRPTKCAKWDEALFYLSEQYNMCTTTAKLDVVTCKAKVAFVNLVPNVELDECEHIHARPVEDPRQMSQKEISDPEFQKLVDMSVKLFNSRIRSPFWYELVHVEKPMVGYASGRYQTFDLHMASTKCRVEEIEATTPETREKKCGPVDTKFLVSCSVQAWTRDWSSPDHQTLDLTACQVIPSNAFADSRNRGQVRMRHEHCVQSFLPKLVNLFNAQNNLSEQYGDPMIDNIEERMILGTNLDFDIYLKPKPQRTECTVSDGSDKGCMTEHFYTCKASIRIHSVRTLEELQLANCARIQPVLIGETEAEPRDSLENIKRKAIQLYNTKLAQNYEYGLVEISNVTFKTDFGVRTEFNLVLKPRECQKNTGAQRCQPDLSEIRVNCQVLMHQHPWLPESETLLLKNCFQRFGSNWADGEGELTVEEQNSEEFKQMINRLSELHRPHSPIIYGVKKVQNTKFHILAGWRNITLELVFQPIGCNRSDEVRYQMHCLDPTKQDEMLCDGLIAENEQSFGMKHLYLSNCRENWITESPRPMTQLEQESHWFQESIKSAWHLQIDMPNGTNLYTLTGIKEPIIETAQDRKITYTMTLLETECVKKRDEYQFENGKSELCPIKENPTEKSCTVNYTLTRDGKYTLNIRCHT